MRSNACPPHFRRHILWGKNSGVDSAGKVDVVPCTIRAQALPLRTLEPEKTSLQRETGRVVRNLAVFGLSLCALVVILYGLTRGYWLNGLLAGITLAMAMLPEEFPVVLTIFLALGA